MAKITTGNLVCDFQATTRFIAKVCVLTTLSLVDPLVLKKGILKLTHDAYAGTENSRSPVCQSNTLFEPYTQVCAPINDITHQFMPPAPVTGAEVPVIGERRSGHGREPGIQNLDELRKREGMRNGLGNEDSTGSSGAASDTANDLPVPGGIGAGTNYKPGTHQVLEHAVFHTKMFIQPDGLDSLAQDWQLLTPATNHTDSATEFVGIYTSYLEEGWFGIFGRPCTETYPCPDGDTSNGWQAGWSWPFSEPRFECNITEIVDQGGHLQKVMHYANETVQLDQGDPPLWQNAIYLWNYCTDAWDLYWQHQYRENKRDCSVEGCYRWGPILETFGTQSEINELGYEDSLLYHDGRWSLLSPDETDFIPPIAPWLLLHLDPNRGFGVGNRYVLAPLSVSIDIKPGNQRNPINPDSKGAIWVAIFSDTDPNSPFDPSSEVDISNVEFGRDGAKAIRHKVKDINKDGLGDLLLRFKIPETGIACGDTEATLSGETYDGANFSGTDSIKTVGCKSKKCHKKKHHNQHHGEYHADDCDDEKHHGEHKEKERHDDDHDGDHKKR